MIGVVECATPVWSAACEQWSQRGRRRKFVASTSVPRSSPSLPHRTAIEREERRVILRSVFFGWSVQMHEGERLCCPNRTATRGRGGI